MNRFTRAVSSGHALHARGHGRGRGWLSGVVSRQTCTWLAVAIGVWLAAVEVSSAEAREAAPAKQIRAVRVAEVPVTDGRLDEPVWQAAEFVSDLRQKQPNEGAPPSERTEFAIVYDDRALYVGARMFFAERRALQAVMTRRDQTGSAEYIMLSLDTFRDRRTAFSFAVTAAGVLVDWYHPDDDESARDYSYDPIWEARTAIDADQWTAEIRIPFSQLRYPDHVTHVWGVNFGRYMPHKNEDLYWIPVPKATTGWSSHFGELHGISALDAALRLEVRPYVTGRATLMSGDAVAADPLVDELDAAGRAGLDVKLGLGPNLVIDGTFNPDFSQVEADPAVVNLSAFEPFYEERRPFFVEGNGLLTGRGPLYYYSRRIGGPPRGEVEADYAAMPGSTTILGAAKLTGRVSSGMSIAALGAVTSRTHATIIEPGMTVAREVAVEPLTSYGVMRLQQEFGRNASVVGMSLAGLYRDLDAGEPLAGQMSRRSLAGGVDWSIRFQDAAYELAGYIGGSYVGGEEAAITRIQTGSTHHFQRPDQDHVAVDPTQRSLVGSMSEVAFNKRSGRWVGGVGGLFLTPGFDINDTGYLPTSDELAIFTGLGHRDTRPGHFLQSWSVSSEAFNFWNFDGARKPFNVYSSVDLTWKNFWTTSISGQVATPGLADRLTRGGPLIGLGWSERFTLSAGSAPAALTSWNARVAMSGHQTGETGVHVSAGLTLRPVDRLSLAFMPRYVHARDNRQYVATIADPAATATFGNRYVFATIQRRELAMQMRMQLAFSPTLLLDLYAEPFVSSGRYARFGELPAPRSRELMDIGDIGPPGYEDLDFSLLSLRSTLVLRWEFLPGSVLSLAWQQDQQNELPAAESIEPALFGETFAGTGAHTLALKLNYWWSGSL